LEKKAVSGIMLTLLLTSMLTLAFNIQPAKAEPGTIYIRADGSVDPATAPILNVGNVFYTFTSDIYGSIVIERDDIVVDGAGCTIEGTESGTGIDLSIRKNVTIKNVEIKRFLDGIYLYYSFNNSISGNNITNNKYGIQLHGSSNNSISGNDITANNYGGIELWYLWPGIGVYYASNSNSISGNNIANNAYGIWLYYASNNSITRNDITNNGEGIRLYGSLNNSISQNDITNMFGIYLYGSSNISITGNNITNNDYGISLLYSPNNSITGNNITNNNWGASASRNLQTTKFTITTSQITLDKCMMQHGTIYIILQLILGMMVILLAATTGATTLA